MTNMALSKGAIFGLLEVRPLFSRPRNLEYGPRMTIRTFRDFRKATTMKGMGIQRDDPHMPSYPYGPERYYPQADQGLFGGSRPQTGNKISKGRNKGKTKRSWQPNIKLETLRSEALNKDLTLRVTHTCLRTIKKCGGLDQYLLGDKPARIKELGLLGWKLRWAIMNAPSMQEKYKAERADLGLRPRSKPYETFEEAMSRQQFQREIRKEQKAAWEELREKDLRFKRHVRQHWGKTDDTPWRTAATIRKMGRRQLDPLAPVPEYGTALG